MRRQIRANTHTHTQDNYTNPRCASAPRLIMLFQTLSCLLYVFYLALAPVMFLPKIPQLFCTSLVNPWRACAARVIVLGLCVCVCVCVRSNLPPHTLESQKKDTNRFIAIREQFLKRRVFLKRFVQKVMA